MSDTIAVHKDMGSLDVSQQLSTYTKVVIHGKDERVYSAENNPNDGLTLELDCPWCESNAMPRRILNRITGSSDSSTGRGYQYQPYTAGDIDLDPAAEIGDAISSPLVFGGIYTRSKTFGHLMLSNVSAPSDEELNHEYQFESPEVREFKRETGTLRASLTITNGSITSEVTRMNKYAFGVDSDSPDYHPTESLSSRISQTEEAITAKVSREGGTRASFGWTLDADGFYLYSGNKEVMKCTSGGLSVAGNIDGKTGTIGDFTIKKGALYTNNMETMQSTQTTGLHLSKNGIKIGQNFSAAAGGTVTATNINLKGSINFYNSDGTLAGSLTAANVRKAAQDTINNGTNWSSAYASTSVGGYCHDGVTDYQDHFGWSDLLGGYAYKQQQFYAQEIIANSGLRGKIYCTDAYGSNGAYRTPYYKKISFLTGASLDYSEVWTGYYAYTLSTSGDSAWVLCVQM